MPLNMDRTERKYAIIGVSVLVAAIALVLLLGRYNEDDPGYPSSTSSHPNGALAAYLTLQESGYDIQHWYSSPAELPSDASGSTLILAEPFGSRQEDKAEIARFISGGGRVIAIGSAAGYLLPRDNATWLTVPRTEWKSTPPSVPSRLTRGGPITANQSIKWDVKNADEIVHFSSDDGPAVISYGFGKGEVIWWASAVPLTNRGVKESGNLELLLNSVGESGTHVYWDEYFHSTHHSLYATVADTPLKFIGWQFLLFAALVIATYARRSGPIKPLAERSRLSPLEFIETLGALYQRFRSPNLAVEVAYDRFRHLLLKRTGVKRDAEPELVAKVVSEKLHCSEQRVLDDLRQIDAARYNHSLSEADALHMVQQITKYQADLMRTGTARGEH